MTTVIDGLGYPESLRWHEGTLWFADHADGVVRRLCPDRSAEVVATVPGRVSGLGWLPDGTLLAVSMEERRIYRQERDGTLRVHADFSAAAGGEGNDLLVDDAGIAHVGNFGFDLMSGIAQRPTTYLYAPPGPPQASVVTFAPDGTEVGRSVPLDFPNGMVLLDGGTTLVVAETLAFRLTAFRRAADGTLSDPSPWASLIPGWQWRALNAGGPFGTVVRWFSGFLQRPAIAQRNPSPVAPDGMANGRDGTIWAANAARGECVRIAAGGKILERVRVPGYALSCVVDGDDPSVLWVASVPAVQREVSARLRAATVRAVRISA